MTLLQLEHIKKVYGTRFSEAQVTALSDITFSVEEGEFIAIMGESGSGKSTLLNILAGIDRATSGNISLNGVDFTKIPEKKMAETRRKKIGFVFQEFNLLNTLSLKDNILLPIVLDGKKVENHRDELNEIASKLSISNLLNKYPYEVSGGQKQRAAVARALITNPDIVLADEPTGALDSKTATEVLEIFDLIHAMQQTVLMVTHSAIAASHASRVLFIRDGKVFHQLFRGDATPEMFYLKIVETLTVTTAGGR